MENLVSPASLQQFYSNKKVFLTGHTGFKGAWLNAWLQLLGADVKGYALKPEYENRLFDFLHPHNSDSSILADIRDREKLKKEIISFQPDYIFHLAAQPLVRRSYEIPAETFEINVAGTANLLESVIGLKKNCQVVVITTDKVYENKESDILYREQDVLGGYDPYSASKACTELVVNSFRNSFFNTSEYKQHGKTIASVRAGNVIGGGDWSKDRIIPDIVRSLSSNLEIEVRNPNAVRPWQHVLEPIAGYLMLGAALTSDPFKYSKAFNFGPLPEDHLTVRQIVEDAIQTWGNGKWVDRSSKNQPHEAGLLKLDISRAMKELNWKPKLSAEEAIKWTISWYKQPANNQANFSLEQIKKYQAL